MAGRRGNRSAMSFPTRAHRALISGTTAPSIHGNSNAFEFPWMLGAVVPLMSARCALVGKLIADRFPRRPAIVRALNLLAKPSARLRSVKAVRIHQRTFDMINFPARKMRTAHLPILTFAVGGQDEGAFFCADQESYCAHEFTPNARTAARSNEMCFASASDAAARC